VSHGKDTQSSKLGAKERQKFRGQFFEQVSEPMGKVRALLKVAPRNRVQRAKFPPSSPLKTAVSSHVQDDGELQRQRGHEACRGFTGLEAHWMTNPWVPLTRDQLIQASKAVDIKVGLGRV
jgi:hypothetical protein